MVGRSYGITMPGVKLALPRFEPIVGDLQGNACRVIELATASAKAGVDVLLLPELAICGYPPHDLLLRSGFVQACEQAIDRVASKTPEGLLVLIGSPVSLGDGRIANALIALRNGDRIASAHKRLLPMYDVFDETRWFTTGEEACVVDHAGRTLGLLVCEDLWQGGDAQVDARWCCDPVADVAAKGCDVMIAASASPIVIGKHQRQIDRLVEVSAAHRCPVVSLNQAGANDDLVFGGAALAVHPDGSMCPGRPPMGQSDAMLIVDLEDPTRVDHITQSDDELRCRALIESVRCYVQRTGSGGVLVGLSGGIDSAVTAAIAAAAIGPNLVQGVSMPSMYSLGQSHDDAAALVELVGMRPLVTLPIGDLHRSIRDTLGDAVSMCDGDITDQNLQARARGVLLMAMSNASDSLVLATGNKSELAVGYATLYGDMCGAVAVLGDVLKTQVYSMAKWMNANHEAIGLQSPPIPLATIARAPTAELAPNQCDQDSLPPYAVLDDIIAAVVDHDCGVEEATGRTGLDEDFVAYWMAVIDRNQFKRAQAAVIPKVARRSFGRGRRWPIVAR